MKAFFLAVMAFGLAGAALFYPVAGKTMWQRAQERGIPKAAAKLTAHGLRAGWDWVFAEPRPAQATPHPPPPRHPSRAAARRISREGIVAQPPKEKLDSRDRTALNALISKR